MFNTDFLENDYDALSNDYHSEWDIFQEYELYNQQPEDDFYSINLEDNSSFKEATSDMLNENDINSQDDILNINDAFESTNKYQHESEKILQSHSSDISFNSAHYTDAEIDKMKHDVDMVKHEMNSRKSVVSNWESKVSLNNTKEHRLNGDYDDAVRHLNEAKSQYNDAVSRYNSAISRLNNAR